MLYFLLHQINHNITPNDIKQLWIPKVIRLINL